VFDLAAKRQLNRGIGDGLTRAMEIVVTPVIMGAAGGLVDAWLGTRPGFTIGFAAFGIVGIFVKLWIRYDQDMRAHEAALPQRPVARGPVAPRPSPASPAPTDVGKDGGPV
jgi:hypothetical protein